MRYLLTNDGDTCEVGLEEFARDNIDMATEDLEAIGALKPGETFEGGGGAAPVWSITRILKGPQ